MKHYIAQVVYWAFQGVVAGLSVAVICLAAGLLIHSAITDWRSFFCGVGIVSTVAAVFYGLVVLFEWADRTRRGRE